VFLRVRRLRDEMCGIAPQTRMLDIKHTATSTSTGLAFKRPRLDVAERLAVNVMPNLDGIAADVALALAKVKGFIALDKKAQAEVLAKTNVVLERNAAIVNNIKASLCTLKKQRTEDARHCRLAVVAAVLDHSQVEGKLSNKTLGAHLGIHADTVDTALKLVNGDLAESAHSVMSSKRKPRSDRIDYDGSKLKDLALDYLLCHTRDSPKLNDQVTIRVDGHRALIACRYLTAKRGEVYFNFIRDLSDVFSKENPHLSLTDHSFVSKSVFLKWLREWKFIKDEEWYVCVCLVCYNIEQIVGAAVKLIRRCHGRKTSLLPANVPVRAATRAPTLSFSAQQLDCEGGPEDSDDEQPVNAECSTVDRCMAASFRQPVFASIPRSGGELTRYSCCFLRVINHGGLPVLYTGSCAFCPAGMSRPPRPLRG